MLAKTRTITLTVNGAPVTAEVEARLTLADFLREELDLTGTHLACEHGVCGNCTVLVDGASARSCLMFAVQADGAEITTVEGLAPGEQLHPLQEAFWENHGLQCGFCTPAMLLTSLEFLGTNPSPSEDEVREAISGVLCRCTDAAVALGGVAPTPVLAGPRDGELRGRSLDEATLREASREYTAGLDPPSDVHADAEYRSEVAAVLTRRALALALQRATKEV